MSVTAASFLRSEKKEEGKYDYSAFGKRLSWCETREWCSERLGKWSPGGELWRGVEVAVVKLLTASILC